MQMSLTERHQCVRNSAGVLKPSWHDVRGCFGAAANIMFKLREPSESGGQQRGSHAAGKTQVTSLRVDLQAVLLRSAYVVVSAEGYFCSYSWTSLFRTRLIRNLCYFEVKLILLCLTVTWCCKLGYFETPLFRTIFHDPWDFRIAGYDCIVIVSASIALVVVLQSSSYSLPSSDSKTNRFLHKPAITPAVTLKITTAGADPE